MKRILAKSTVHVRGKEIKVDLVLADKKDTFSLDPDDALDLGIKLLKAAYTAKAS